ncbi:protein S100-A4-like [Protopterus annectens]|uniref:protein S100-A4-like n=1 Tax=Protopterus annectens TaxID=7888 RepID=UPI001CFAA3CB|nr:protein S100-A4-like [Protopterus annectens]
MACHEGLTDLETCMDGCIRIFRKYAMTDGDMLTLSLPELKKLLQTELPRFIKKGEEDKVAREMMTNLDTHVKDNKISFQEFMSLVSTISVYAHSKTC